MPRIIQRKFFPGGLILGLVSGTNLLHEFAHHLDVGPFAWSDTLPTRGFYWRVDGLYHLALATPADKRKPLAWIRTGTGWRIDWAKLR